MGRDGQFADWRVSYSQNGGHNKIWSEGANADPYFSLQHLTAFL